MYDLNRLFLSCRPLEESDRYRNKYTLYATYRNLTNYRIMDLSSIMNYHKSNPEAEVPRNIVRMMDESPELLVVANVIQRQVVEIIVRSLKDKSFTSLLVKNRFPYGVGLLRRRYLDPIVVVEGALDRDVISNEVYPRAVASLSGGLSTFQLEVLKLLTNTLILAYDMDETGAKAYWRDKARAEERGFFVYRLNHPYKDPGDYAEFLFLGDSFKCSRSLDVYNSQMLKILNSLGYQADV